MKAILYTTTDPEAPERSRFLAKVLDPIYAPHTAKGRDGYAPTYFAGPDADTALAKAQVYIETQEKARAAAPPRRKAKPKDDAPADAPPEDECGEFF